MINYEVQVLGNHIKIWRSDWKSTRSLSWEKLQEIKNEAFGENAVAVEFFPANDDVISEVNMRHLWLISSEIMDDVKRGCGI